MNNCNCAENQFTNPGQIANIVRRSAQAVARLGFTSLKLDSCGQFNNLTLWADELNRTGVVSENSTHTPHTQHTTRTTLAYGAPHQPPPPPGTAHRCGSLLLSRSC